MVTRAARDHGGLHGQLKKLAATCELGAFLEEAVRDRRIADLHASTIRCDHPAMPGAEVTWDRACSIAPVMEAAAEDTKEMLTPHTAGLLQSPTSTASYSYGTTASEKTLEHAAQAQRSRTDCCRDSVSRHKETVPPA